MLTWTRLVPSPTPSPAAPGVSLTLLWRYPVARWTKRKSLAAWLPSLTQRRPQPAATGQIPSQPSTWNWMKLRPTDTAQWVNIWGVSPQRASMTCTGIQHLTQISLHSTRLKLVSIAFLPMWSTNTVNIYFLKEQQLERQMAAEGFIIIYQAAPRAVKG